MLKNETIFRNWLIALTVISLFAVLLSISNYLTTPKIGYVDSARLLDEFLLAKEAREKFQKSSQEWQNNVKTLEGELSGINQELVSFGNTWNKKKFSEKQKALAEKQREFIQYQRAVNDKAAKLEKELMQPVFDELNIKLKEFGNQRGYTVIWGTVAGGNILYAQNGVDLTDKVLEYVHNGQ